VSDWDGRGWFRSAPKKPPPEHGIKMKKSGTTWWGQQWIEALEHILLGDSGRLARGRTYARAGRTHDLMVNGGKVTAKVTGSRATPYEITIELAQLPDSAWRDAIQGMAAKAQFAAELLAGQMPKQIGELFREAATSLFPAQRADLVTKCTCPDWGDPCKHIAATHYVLGEALDRDPFLLFELRGRTKEQVLDALRSARSGETPAKARRTAAQSTARAELEIPQVTLGPLDSADYDRPRQALPALHFSFDAPITHGAVVRQLGAPAAWSGNESPGDLLAPLVRAAAERARGIALAEPVAEAADSIVEPRTPQPRAKRDRGRASGTAMPAKAPRNKTTRAKPRIRNPPR
jgi:uncharacterized Zn finger protein